MIKLVFYGTGEFASKCLESISSDDRFNIDAVITQPDRPIGRKQEFTSSPVKKIALNLGCPIYQPETLNEFEPPELAGSDLGVVAEYGIIIPKRLLELPRRGTVNLHASILPKYRGASPIQTAIINGEKKTGVTLMLMDEKMDHGPIIAYAETTIDDSEIRNNLFDRLAKIAGQLFLQKAALWVDNKVIPVEQKHADATYCKILQREDGKVDFNKTAKEIYNLWRGLTPWPGVWASFQGKYMKFIDLSLAERNDINPGVITTDNGRILIGCAGNSSVEILELQLEGKNVTEAKEFINGHRQANNVILNV